MRPRRVPIRTCVACRTTDAKRALLRVVRQPDGTVCYDAKGKMSGRGAYVCARVECVEQARKQKKLERSLKVEKIAPELFQELLQIVSQNNATAPAEPPPAQQLEIGEQNDRG